MTKYPMINFEFTDGDKTTNISFNGVKSTQEEDKVRELANHLTKTMTGFSYVKAELITSTTVDTND